VAILRSPRLYHITHIDNLTSIVSDGFLYSEAALLARGGPEAVVGMSHIKKRRMEMPMPCHPGTKVGEYVPFYFCSRSVMLYLLYMGNHPDLDYHGGQESMLHLEFDFEELAQWADMSGRAWAITPTNAGAYYSKFYADRSALSAIDWEAVCSDDWRVPNTKEHKQAEFLIHDVVPWSLVHRIGVHHNAVCERVMRILGDSKKPLVEVQAEWYY
jgi:hypothetical protein